MQAGGVPIALVMCGLWASKSGQNFLILIQSLRHFLKQHDLGMCFKEWEIVFIFMYFALGNFWIFFILKMCFYDTVESAAVIQMLRNKRMYDSMGLFLDAVLH